jgi:alpha-L-fucosidase
MKYIFAALLSFSTIISNCQPTPKPYGPLPTAAQLNWQETEMYCLVHFGAATYTDKEWAGGDESAEIINPEKFSAMQIVSCS